MRRLASLQRRLWKVNLALALIVFLVLAVWWIGIDLGTFPQPAERTVALMEQADLTAILVFAIEIVSGFGKAKDKAMFLRKNWLGILVLLPLGAFFRAFRAVSETEILGIRAAARLERMPAFFPQIAVIGKTAGKGIVGLHHWLCHYTVFSDFFAFAGKLAKRFT